MTYVELATAMADYIVNFYNPARRHSSLNYLTPDDFELLTSTHNPARTLIGVTHSMGSRSGGSIFLGAGQDTLVVRVSSM